MKTITRTLALASGLALAAAQTHALNWTEGFKKGNPEIKSITQITFGPEGILFAADSKAAAVIAIETGDNKPGPAGALKIENINQKVAALLGTSADLTQISDMAVNPVSHKTYLAVSRGRGPEAVPVLVRVDSASQLEVVALDKVNFSRVALPKAPLDKEPAPAAGGNRFGGGGNPRMESITDIAFVGDRVLVAGLSNEEFSSSLRSIPFPFDKEVEPTSVEIYHGSHGRYETRAPIRTFVPMKIGDETQLLAAYTCTPLVQVPLKQIEPNAKVKGKTVAELGNRNRPIDMIVYNKDGKDYLLLANSSRGVMKVATDNLTQVEPITAPVPDKKGLSYETIADWTGIEHLDKLDAKNCVVIRKTDAGQILEAKLLP
jgi:hypothetical protein